MSKTKRPNSAPNMRFTSLLLGIVAFVGVSGLALPALDRTLARKVCEPCRDDGLCNYNCDRRLCDPMIC
jgi:hypothetical protein